MRFDVKIVYVQEFHFAVEAETAKEAGDLGIERLNAGAADDPDKTDIHTSVERGVV